MRSISGHAIETAKTASAGKSELSRYREAQDGSLPESTVEAQSIARQDLEFIQKLFADDPDALRVLRARAEGKEGEEDPCGSLLARSPAVRDCQQAHSPKVHFVFERLEGLLWEKKRAKRDPSDLSEPFCEFVLEATGEEIADVLNDADVDPKGTEQIRAAPLPRTPSQSLRAMRSNAPAKENASVRCTMVLNRSFSMS